MNLNTLVINEVELPSIARVMPSSPIKVTRIESPIPINSITNRIPVAPIDAYDLLDDDDDEYESSNRCLGKIRRNKLLTCILTLIILILFGAFVTFLVLFIIAVTGGFSKLTFFFSILTNFIKKK